MAKTIEEKTRDTIFKMSDAFFSMFSSYNSFAVENALGKLPEK